MHSKTICSKTIYLMVLLIWSYQSNATIFVDQGIQKDVAETELILTGKLIEKNHNNDVRKSIIYKRTEGGLMEKIVIDDDAIYTVFTFKISEIIKGQFNESMIDLYMLGGCINSRCEYYSVNYDFQIGEEALLFLQYIPENDFYISANASHLVFKIDTKTNSATRKSKGYVSETTELLQKSSENEISIDLIKELVNEK